MADENKTKRSDTQLHSRKQFCSVLEESDNYTQKKLKTHKTSKTKGGFPLFAETTGSELASTC